jgi:hypothetical protein
MENFADCYVVVNNLACEKGATQYEVKVLDHVDTDVWFKATHNAMNEYVSKEWGRKIVQHFKTEKHPCIIVDQVCVEQFMEWQKTAAQKAATMKVVNQDAAIAEQQELENAKAQEEALVRMPEQYFSTEKRTLAMFEDAAPELADEAVLQTLQAEIV